MVAPKIGRMPRGRQSGATAIEFALVFPALFSTIYAGLVYGFVYFLQQQVNFAAQEGVRAAIAQDPASTSFATNVTSAVTEAVRLNFGVAAGSALPMRVTGPTITFPTASTIQVSVTYNLDGLFPTISFPVIGPIPGLPATLQGLAVGRVS